MHHCFAPPADWSESEIRLSDAEAHHLLRVLRLKPGDEVGVFDGCGRIARARLELRVESGGARRHSRERSQVADIRLPGATLTPIEVTHKPPPPVTVILIQALAKGARMDLIFEKATELGVSAVWPVMTERVVAEMKSDRAGQRAARWRRIVLSAAKQCGAYRLPDVDPVQSLEDALNRREAFDVLFYGSLESGAEPFRAAIEKARALKPARIGVVIGPEGDLTAEEYGHIRRAGGVGVSFGELVLRVETAALYALSVLACEFTAAGEGPPAR